MLAWNRQYDRVQPIYGILVYRPPGSTSSFLSDFQDLLSSTIKLDRIIIVGDFNIHAEDLSNSSTREFLNMMNSFNFSQHVSGPTHRAGHTLDLVFSYGLLVDKLQINDVVFSDHKSVSFHINLNSESLLPVSAKQRRIINSSTILNFSSLFDFVPPSSDDVELLTNSFNDHCLKILDQVAPYKTSRSSSASSSPWLNNQILELRRSYRKAERRWKRTGLVVHREYFKELLESYNEAVENARSSFFSNLICQNKNNPKVLFDTISSIVSSPPQQAQLSSADDCNRFLHFFANKVLNLRSSIPPALAPSGGKAPQCSESFTSFSPITLNDLTSIISQMKLSSCSSDILTPSVLVGSLASISPSLLTMINSSLSQGCVPSYFKNAVVTPLLKKPNLDASSTSNFRPISKLPFISKVLEKVVETQLRSWFSKSKISDPFQSGFLKQHSTETALVRVHNDLLMAADAGKCSVMVLLDLSAAFDTVDHNVLLNRLKALAGISGSALDWLSSYLTNRTFTVKSETFSSDTASLTCGVPQGSVLGPLLFAFYILPLAGIIQSFPDISYHIYADDIQLYMSFMPHQLDRLATLVLCLTQISNWLSSNFLVLNANKTETLIAAPPELQPKIEQEIASFCPSAKANIRNLGVIFDPALSLDSHVKTISRSCFFQLRNISKVRKLVSTADLEKIIHAFVSSRLDYCNALFTGLSKTSLSRLQAIQNAAARLLTKSSRRAHITPGLQSLHWLPVEYRIQFKVLVLTYRALNNQAPSYLSELLSPHTTSRNLRSTSENLLAVPRTRLKTKGDRAFQTIAPRLWNSPPSNLRLSNTVEVFKNHLKTHLFIQAFPP
uniref:Reverse transcriptase domain-containing protein n=1 Tax=Nothobranchius furzeri TaxID=105023 RepID=A0A8C6PYD4_NOTFU